MTQSDQTDLLATALAKAQGQIGNAAKDSKNPYFHSNYADLASVWDAIRKPLADNGLSVEQHPAAEGAKVTVTTVLRHASGQYSTSELSLTAMRQTQGGGWEECASPQAIGSTITYARRYALSAIAGVAPEDDDGNAASGTTEPRGNAAPRPAVVISEAQRKRLFAKFKGSDKSEDDVQAILKAHGIRALAGRDRRSLRRRYGLTLAVSR